MGWTTCYSANYYKADGSVDRRKECDSMYTRRAGDDSQTDVSVLKSSMVGSVYYAAVRFRDSKDDRVVGVVCLTCGRSSDGTIWGFRNMDETMGPYECACPPSILALLSPTDNKYALDWRARCRAKAEEKAERAKAKRKNGGEPIPPSCVPAGTMYRWDRVHRWHVVSSREYVMSHAYSGVRFSSRWTADGAMESFLKQYGTEAQRAEYTTKTGRDVSNVA